MFGVSAVQHRTSLMGSNGHEFTPRVANDAQENDLAKVVYATSILSCDTATLDSDLVAAACGSVHVLQLAHKRTGIPLSQTLKRWLSLHKW